MAFREVRFYGSPEEVNAQWLEARKGGVGGSEAGAVMGLSRFESPLDVWLRKTGRAEPPDISAKPAVEWGNRLEGVVAAKFAENHPEYRVRRRNAMLVGVERPWAFADLDRTLTGPDGSMGVLEVKTAGARSAGDWAEGVPVHYAAQVAHYLSVTGWGFAWVAVLIGGQDYREFRMELDGDDIAAVAGAVDRFWNGYVLQDVMPALIGGRPEAAALLSMHPAPSGEVVPADLPQVEERMALKAERDALDARISELDNQVKAAIGGSRGVESHGWRVTWPRSAGKGGPRDMGLRYARTGLATPIWT